MHVLPFSAADSGASGPLRQLAAQAADFLLVGELFGLPLAGEIVESLLVTLQFPLACDQPLGLPFDLLLPGSGPSLQFALLATELFVPLRQLAAKQLEIPPFLCKLGIGQTILVGQSRADLSERMGNRGRRRRSGNLHPEFLGRQTNFERLAVHAAQLFANLLQRRPIAVDLLTLTLGSLPLFLEVRQRAPVLRGHFLPLSAGLFLILLPLIEELLAESAHLAPGLGQLGFGPLKLLPLQLDRKGLLLRLSLRLPGVVRRTGRAGTSTLLRLDRLPPPPEPLDQLPDQRQRGLATNVDLLLLAAEFPLALTLFKLTRFAGSGDRVSLGSEFLCPSIELLLASRQTLFQLTVTPLRSLFSGRQPVEPRMDLSFLLLESCFPQLELVLPLAEPEPGGAGSVVQLCAMGVEPGFAMIQVLLSRTEVRGQFISLTAELAGESDRRAILSGGLFHPWRLGRSHFGRLFLLYNVRSIHPASA